MEEIVAKGPGFEIVFNPLERDAWEVFMHIVKSRDRVPGDVECLGIAHDAFAMARSFHSVAKDVEASGK